MSTISIPRLPTKRSHVASVSLNEDPISKRQKTVRTYKSTTTPPYTNTTTTSTITTTATASATSTNGRYPTLPPSSSILSSSEFLLQPDSRIGSSAGNPASALPADFFDTTSISPPVTTLPIGSRDRVAAPPTAEPPSISGNVNEDEWAAFEAEIAETEATTAAASIIPSSAVISAAPTGPGGHVSVENDSFEDEAAFDREDAQNKLVQEFEEMESLESRVQKLKEQREALRAKVMGTAKSRMEVMPGRSGDDDEEDDDDDDDWIHLSR